PSTTGLTVLDAWTRAANAGETGGLFFTIENGTDQDQVLSAAHTDVAAAVELHETVMSGEMAGMQHVERLLIAAGTTLTAEPGGYHLMLIDLQQDLVSGEAIPVLFTFESGTQVAVEAVVR